MSLPLQQHAFVLDWLAPQHVVPALTLAVCAVWALAEILSLPRSRKQLDIPRGDWLTFALGTIPVAGAGAVLAWQYFFSTTRFEIAVVAAGLVLCVAGIGLRTWSKLVLGRFYTFSIALTEEHRILTDGPYRFVRHPLYLGTFLAVTGLFLLTQSWATLWLLTLPTMLVYGIRLVREDTYLIQQLGPDYRHYAQHTARLIPFVW